MPNMEQFRRILWKKGFHKLPKRGKGDHEVWYNPSTGRQVTVDSPNKKVPGKGLFKAMLKQAGIKEEEFRGLG